jgi:hypothetical protein
MYYSVSVWSFVGVSVELATAHCGLWLENSVATSAWSEVNFRRMCTVKYKRITSTKSPSFCMTNFTASQTNLTGLLPQSHDCSCYVSRPVLAYPPLWLQKHTDLRAHNFAHSPDLCHQPRLANVVCACSRIHYGINSAIILKANWLLWQMAWWKYRRFGALGTGLLSRPT